MPTAVSPETSMSFNGPRESLRNFHAFCVSITRAATKLKGRTDPVPAMFGRARVDALMPQLQATRSQELAEIEAAAKFRARLNVM